MTQLDEHSRQEALATKGSHSTADPRSARPLVGPVHQGHSLMPTNFHQNQRVNGLVIDLNPILEPAGLRGIVRATGIWTVGVIAGSALIAFLVGTLFMTRDQNQLTADLKLQTAEAAGALENSLNGAQAITTAPLNGSAVALVQVSRLRLQHAISEGAESKNLRSGPAHVFGTAGLGQPGNSVVVGRRSAFGGPFNKLAELRVGDRILITTAQGQSVYAVTQVGEEKVTPETYAPSQVDQLTLLTSSTWWPWSNEKADIVRAKLETRPFTPTPQNGWDPGADGRHGDGSAWPLLILELLVLAIGAATATILYRRWSAPATYLLTTPALLAMLVFFGLTLTRVFPGWF